MGQIGRTVCWPKNRLSQFRNLVVRLFFVDSRHDIVHSCFFKTNFYSPQYSSFKPVSSRVSYTYPRDWPFNVSTHLQPFLSRASFPSALCNDNLPTPRIRDLLLLLLRPKLFAFPSPWAPRGTVPIPPTVEYAVFHADATLRVLREPGARTYFMAWCSITAAADKHSYSTSDSTNAFTF